MSVDQETDVLEPAVKGTQTIRWLQCPGICNTTRYSARDSQDREIGYIVENDQGDGTCKTTYCDKTGLHIKRRDDPQTARNFIDEQPDRQELPFG